MQTKIITCNEVIPVQGTETCCKFVFFLVVSASFKHFWGNKENVTAEFEVPWKHDMVIDSCWNEKLLNLKKEQINVSQLYIYSNERLVECKWWIEEITPMPVFHSEE